MTKAGPNMPEAETLTADDPVALVGNQCRPPLRITTILIEPLPIKSEKGCGRYRVMLADGSELLEATRDPEYDSCRALMARGVTGALVICGRDGVCRARIYSIEAAARFSIFESSTGGLQLGRWKAPPDWDAVSCHAGDEINALP
jgi:hypothetical protein